MFVGVVKPSADAASWAVAAGSLFCSGLTAGLEGASELRELEIGEADSGGEPGGPSAVGGD